MARIDGRWEIRSCDSFDASTLVGRCVALEIGVKPDNDNELSNSADDKLDSVSTSLNIQKTANDRKQLVVVFRQQFCKELFCTTTTEST